MTLVLVFLVVVAWLGWGVLCILRLRTLPARRQLARLEARRQISRVEQQTIEALVKAAQDGDRSDRRGRGVFRSQT